MDFLRSFKCAIGGMQGNLISSPTATYGSSDSCFVPPHAAGLPPTPSYGVAAQQQQQPLLSMPLPPLESPPLQPELDFSLAKLFDSPADCSLLNEHEVCCLNSSLKPSCLSVHDFSCITR